MTTNQRCTASLSDTADTGYDPGPDAASSTAELTALRSDNVRLREELGLRDLALDGIRTTFVIAERTSLEPTIVYCNKAAADMLGRRRDELIGSGLSAIAANNVSRTLDFRRDYETLAAGHNIAYESEAKAADGSTIWRGVTIIPIFDANGSLRYSVAMAADITAKKEAARQREELQAQLVAGLRERERMANELHLAQKLESVGRLASGIAHEMNTPMQYVGDCVHFLKTGFLDVEQLVQGWQGWLADLPENPRPEDLRGRSDTLIAQCDWEFLRAEIPKAFERLSEGISRVSNIVNAMKEFAHPDSNEQSAADINHAVRSTLIVATNVYKFVARVDTDLAELPDVICSVGEINQVFLSLLVNAVHGIEDAGRGIETGVISISTARVDDSIVTRFRDNGCGIPPENLSKLYDPFFTTKEVGRGAGQGLAIARSIIVDKHGGEIDVTSTVGCGTEFSVTLPIHGSQRRIDP
jgi:PAS domain S-box-containing protein